MRTFAFLALFIVSWAFAADAGNDNCASAMTQQEMNQCAAVALKAADSAIALFVTSYEKALSSSQVAQFRKAQDAWEQFRRLSCEFEASGVEGGSVYPMVLGYCMSFKANARLTELRHLADCEQGDLSCPAHK